MRTVVKFVAALSLAALLFDDASSARAQSIQTGSLSARLKLIGSVTSSTSGGPTFGVSSGESRFLYVGQQNGTIRIIDFNNPTPVLPATTAFLNFDAALGSSLLVDDTGTGERGMLGAAFHPDYSNPANPAGYRKFYTFTSETIASATPHFVNPLEPPTAAFPYNCQSVIREWTAGAPNAQGITTIDTSIASRVVMRIGKPGQFHNGGALAFGPDKLLYISTGDGGGGGQNGGNDGGNDREAYQGHTNPGNPDTPGGWSGPGNAQDRRTPYGKILRIKPTLDADADTIASPIAGAGWRVPKSNPFTADANAATPVPGWQDSWVDETYAYGFRNPFRISFDKTTGDLYAADVGQDRNSFSREEVDRIVKGGNYGWVKKSGTEFNTNAPSGETPMGNYPVPAGTVYVDPIAQYETTQLGQGGLAVIGGHVYRGSLAPQLAGKYVFGDLNRGTGTGGRLLYTDATGSGLNPVFELNIVGSTLKPNSILLHGVAADSNGEIYYLFGNGNVMQLVGVPEPSSFALAGLALAGLGVVRRRRRASA